MTGDAANIATRLRAVLPPWFGDSNPVLDAVLAGIASVLAGIYSLYAYAVAQTRIRTATGAWLDIIAADFFGTLVQRATNESDDLFRARIVANLFRPRATRAAIVGVLGTLGGYVPKIIEPWSPADCGAYGVGYAGYGAAGAWGSTLLPAQAFVVALRYVQGGIANVAGYGIPTGGYATGSQAEYASLSMGGLTFPDSAVHGAIDATKAAGVTIWTRIENRTTPGPLTVNSAALTINGITIAG